MPCTHKQICCMVEVRNRSCAIWVNIRSGIKAQVHSVFCETDPVTPQQVHCQVDRDGTPRLNDPFKLFVQADWCECFSLCSSTIARFEGTDCDVFVIAGRPLEQYVEHLVVAFTQFHGTQSREGSELRLALVSLRENEAFFDIGVHYENRE